MILCMMCKKKVATVHLTDLINKTEIHLCEECAAKHDAKTFSDPVSLPDLLAFVSGDADQADAEIDALTCPECGLTFAEFRKKQRLGCPNDFTVFRDVLLPAIERVHGARRHVGRTPRHSPEAARRSREIIELRRELEKAVREEAYEEAAALRDRLRTLSKPRPDADAETPS